MITEVLIMIMMKVISVTFMILKSTGTFQFFYSVSFVKMKSETDRASSDRIRVTNSFMTFNCSSSFVSNTLWCRLTKWNSLSSTSSNFSLNLKVDMWNAGGCLVHWRDAVFQAYDWPLKLTIRSIQKHSLKGWSKKRFPSNRIVRISRFVTTFSGCRWYLNVLLYTLLHNQMFSSRCMFNHVQIGKLLAIASANKSVVNCLTCTFWYCILLISSCVR